MSITRLIRGMFMRSLRRADEHDGDVESTQRHELSWLLRRARRTEWGKTHSYDLIRSYADYREAVEPADYTALRPLVMRMIGGERDLLWPGQVRRYAQSSGTSDGKSKYIPISDESLRRNHYAGGRRVVERYLSLYPDSRIFDGKSLILGGSFANELDLPAGSKAKVGDLSANLIDAINPIANLLRIPGKHTALMADWHAKLPALVEAAAKADVTNISGVPSWFLTVLQQLLERTGREKIHDVWPNLEVFFHGGIAFGPYRSEYDRIIDPTRMRYLETYNASEGFFAVQDRTDSRAMRLLTDAGIFYEFLPVDDPSAQPVPAWEVIEGKVYALLISSCNGLWRYRIGDTVKIESIAPLRITIAGRTKHFINAFGEEVMVHNTDAALSRTCEALDCSVKDYTVAPVYAEGGHHGHHQWLIEFRRPPADITEFAGRLDLELQRVNSDYQAKRAGSIFLAPLSVEVAPVGLFERWLEATGKLGGQRKVPRLSNDRTTIEAMLKLK
ncbi:MAG: GH3 auxin-responsive promoter family protein [Paramuribaculum sp.]|nr:GH3 auxin-responsive promoter family protein [Paramuribaculum sp.]